LFDEARRAAEASGSPWWIGGVEMRRAVVSRMAGTWDVAALDRAARNLRDAGHMFDMGAAVVHAADAALYCGSVSEAFRRVREYNAAAFRAGRHAPSSVQGSLTLEATCRALREEPDADGRFQDILAFSLNNRDVLIATVTMFRWGENLLRTGHTEEGLAKLEEAYADRAKHSLVDNYSAEILFRLPRAYLKLEHLDRRRMQRLRTVHAEALRKTRATHLNWRPPTLVNQALLLESVGQRRRADRCFEAAIGLARQQNAQFFVSDGLYEWGLVLRRRGARGAAREKLTAALQIAETGGNLWLVGRCQHEFASL
jgi:tetratricopeptide (TPR) repeat protein